MSLLILIFIGVNNCYWITIFNVTYLEGNKFVNGIILGMAELASGIFCGFLISYTSPKTAFQLCAVVGIVFNAITLFAAPVGSVLSYVTLFIAILGVGGIYTAINILIFSITPKEQVGGAMVFIITIGTSASLFAPLVVVNEAPIPFLTLAAMMALAFICSCLLPDGKDEDQERVEAELE